MVWNLQKTFRKWSLIWFFIRNTQTYKLQLSALRVFKTLEIASMGEFLSSEAGQPEDLYFSKEVFSGLVLCGASIRTFEFLNLKTEEDWKRISQQVKSYYSYKLRLLHEMRGTNFYFLSKDKKIRHKKFAWQFVRKFAITK